MKIKCGDCGKELVDLISQPNSGDFNSKYKVSGCPCGGSSFLTKPIKGTGLLGSEYNLTVEKTEVDGNTVTTFLKLGSKT